ncbi:MAG: phosphatase PAP2 family protein [Eubacteriales bacterium]|nr:phosphatase PAP2 family protein [Eubacteriales bacterium]
MTFLKKYLFSLRENRRFWLLPVLALAWNQSVYYGARILTQHRKHYELLLELDHKIPLVNWMSSVYFLCFLVWGLTYLFMASREKQTAYRFFLADFLGKFCALVIFLIIPTTIVRPEIEGSSVWDFIMRWLYSVDAADNLFPSIHCMVSWYCFIGVRRIRECPLWGKIGMLLFAIAVCISTVTTKQHVVIDIAGGIIIAEIADQIAGRIISRYR